MLKNTKLYFVCRLLLGICFMIVTALGQEAVPSAQALAAQLDSRLQDGSSVVRLKMEIRQPTNDNKAVMQLQVKSQRNKEFTNILYQILWPKERKGESFLLRRQGENAPTGAVFTLPDSLLLLTPAKMNDGIFGSDLSYDDLIENFFTWKNQTFVGKEVVDRVECQILESKPGKGDRVTYPKILSWIDTKRMVTLRVEKYTESGKLAKRIDTTRVAKDDTGRPVAASFSLQRPGVDSITEIEGSNSKHNVNFPVGDFEPEALRVLK